MELQASYGPLGAEGDCEMSTLLLPSPQSEAVTHEMEELSLQPLPPPNGRKHGEKILGERARRGTLRPKIRPHRPPRESKGTLRSLPVLHLLRSILKYPQYSHGPHAVHASTQTHTALINQIKLKSSPKKIPSAFFSFVHYFDKKLYSCEPAGTLLLLLLFWPHGTDSDTQMDE